VDKGEADGLALDGLVTGIAADGNVDGVSVLVLDGSSEEEEGLLLAIKDGSADG